MDLEENNNEILTDNDIDDNNLEVNDINIDLNNDENNNNEEEDKIEENKIEENNEIKNEENDNEIKNEENDNEEKDDEENDDEKDDEENDDEEKDDEEKDDEEKNEETDNEYINVVEEINQPTAKKYWIRDPENVWRLADVLSSSYHKLDDGSNKFVNIITVQKLDGLNVEEIDLNIDDERKKPHPFDPSHSLNLSDLAKLNNLHEAPLLNLLKRRYKQEEIYTFCGDVLISINPYKNIPLLYSLPFSYEDDINLHSENNDEYNDLINDNDDNNNNNNNNNKISLAYDDPKCPHVFSIAARAYRLLSDINEKAMDGKTTNLNQSIIISGESGAGKTEASKYVMRYLIGASKITEKKITELNKLNNNENIENIKKSRSELIGYEIEQRLLQSNIILEAFGNAKTVRNDNSSRFGKYIKLQYDNEYRLSGARTDHFLLEKSRLVSIDEGERNYHIFYQLLTIDENNEHIGDREQLNLNKTPWDFPTLCMGDCIHVSDIDDHEEFISVCNALRTIGISNAEQTYIWEILAMILHLGNIEFEDEYDDDGFVKYNSKSFPMEEIASILGIDYQRFLLESRVNKRTSGRGSMFTIPLNAEKSKDNINAFIKFLYGEIFSWIVKKINYSHKFDSKNINNADDIIIKENNNLFIGILDIFGFEIMENNSFEQLCINYTNERLQQQFNEHVFVFEKLEYEKEGLDWTDITYRDNQPVIDLISKKPHGLMNILEEHGLMGRTPDNGALLRTYDRQHKDNIIYDKPRFGRDESFVVKHFAGEVIYNIDGFIEKNNDSLEKDLLSLMLSTTNPFLGNILGCNETLNGPGYLPHFKIFEFETKEESDVMDTYMEESKKIQNKRSNSFRHSSMTSADLISLTKKMKEEGFDENNDSLNNNTMTKKKKKRNNQQNKSNVGSFGGSITVSYAFRNQLDVLMNTLRNTEPHYIKCIKPNSVKMPGGFSSFLINEQLRYSGVLEVVRIRRETFPTRIDFYHFYSKFKILMYGKNFPKPDDCNIEQCKEACNIIASNSLNNDVYKIGNTKIFLRHYGIDMMKKAVINFYGNKAAKIQSRWRGIQTRKQYIIIKYSIILLQSLIRKKLEKLKYKKIRLNIILIQSFWRSKFYHTKLGQQKDAIIIMQKYIRRMIAMNTCGKKARELKALIKLQTNIRCYLTKKWYQNQKILWLNAIILISSYIRRYKQRKFFLYIKKSIIIIQSNIRGKIARGKYMTLRTEDRLRRENENRKAIYLQSIIRMWKINKLYNKQKNAATLLSNTFRTYKQKNEYNNIRNNIIKTQTLIRMYQNKKNYQNKLKLMIFIQSHIRCFILKCKYKKIYNSIIKIQLYIKSSIRNMKLYRKIKLLYNLIDNNEFDKIEKLLIKNSDLINIRNKYLNYSTIYHQIAKNGNISLYSFLEPQYEHIILNDINNVTPFHLACESGNLDLVKLMSLKTLKKIESTINNDNNNNNNNENNNNDNDILMPLKSFHKNKPKRPSLNSILGTRSSNNKHRRSRTMDNIKKSRQSVAIGRNIHQRINSIQTLNNLQVKKIQKKGGHVLTEDDFLVGIDDVMALSSFSSMNQGKKQEKKLFTGFLRKKKESDFRWLKRWCVLTSKSLKYYHKKTEKIASKVIPLATAMVKRSDKYQRCFEIHSPILLNSRNREGRLYFQSASEENMQSWLTHLQTTTLKQQDTTGRTEPYIMINEELKMNLVSLITNNNETPLHYAIKGAVNKSDYNKNEEIALWLIENGTSIDFQNDDGNTAIHLAIQNNLIELTAALAKKGGNLSLKNNENKSVLEYIEDPLIIEKLQVGLFNQADHFPLLPEPEPKLKDFIYLSFYIEKIQVPFTKSFENPFLRITLYNSAKERTEAPQDILYPAIKTEEYFYFSSTIHIQTPIENIPDGSFLTIELYSKNQIKSWAFYRIKPLTINTEEKTMELYRAPVDLQLERMESSTMWLSGQVYLSQGDTI